MLALKQRQQIIEICQQLSQRGYLAGTGGNVALRIDAESFAVTPSATDYLTMQASDVCVVRLSDGQQLAGSRAPSVETGLHASVLRQRHDVLCSIHTHQPIASAYALMNETLAVTDPASRQLLGSSVPVIGYMPSGTSLLTRLVRRALRPDINAYLMRSHGVLCCGSSVERAIATVVALEDWALRSLNSRIIYRSKTTPTRQNTYRRLLALLETA